VAFGSIRLGVELLFACLADGHSTKLNNNKCSQKELNIMSILSEYAEVSAVSTASHFCAIFTSIYIIRKGLL